MAFHINRLVSMVTLIIGLTGFGSSLRVVVNPQPYNDTTNELNISCIIVGPEYKSKSIGLIGIMKQSVAKTIAFVNVGQLKMGAGVKDTIKAEGHVDTADATKSFLTLTIEKPGREDAGIYMCQVLLADEQSQIVQEEEMGKAIYRWCPRGWKHYMEDGTCIKVFGKDDSSKRLSWSKARESCKTFDGDLVQIHDEHKNNFVLEMFEGGSYEPWIGVKNNASVDFDFRNVDGSRLGTYRPWMSGEPSGDYEGIYKCVFMDTKPTTAGQWGDGRCSYPDLYVCSISIPNIV